MFPWWRHQMETFSALLTLCSGNSPVSGEFPAQRPVTRSFDIFFDLRLNKQLSKQWWGWWFETVSCPLWRQCNATCKIETARGSEDKRYINRYSVTLVIINISPYVSTMACVKSVTKMTLQHCIRVNPWQIIYQYHALDCWCNCNRHLCYMIAILTLIEIQRSNLHSTHRISEPMCFILLIFGNSSNVPKF